MNIKKYLLTTAVALLVGCFSLSSVSAQVDQVSSDTSASQVSAPLLGSSHDYSVTVKTSGVLIVNAKIIISNNSDQPKNDFKFSGLGTTQGKITGFQQIKGRRCVKPDYTNHGCSEYGNPEYDLYYDSYDEPSSYKPLTIENVNGVISGKLPKPVESYQSTGIVLSYYLQGQTTKGILGARKFTFNSLQDDDLVKNIVVSVSTDSDLYTKGNKSKTTSSSYSGSTSDLATSSISSKAFDTAVSNIGNYGNWMYKTGRDIVPGESFKVSGSYSTNWFGLYWYILMIFVLILAALAAGIWWLVKNGRKFIPPTSGINNDQTSPMASSASQNQGNSSSLNFREAATFRNFLSAFLLATVVTLFFFGGMYFFNWLQRITGYAYYQIFTLAEGILAILLIGMTIGYPIYLAIKKGLNVVVVCIISYLLAIILAIIIFVAITSAISNTKNYNSYYPSYPTSSNML